MSDRYAVLRKYAAENPLLGQDDPPPLKVVQLENGRWSASLSANR